MPKLKKLWPYKKAVKFAKRVVRDNLLDKKLPQIYREAAAQPVDERKVVFAESKLTKMPDAYTQLWKLLESRYDFDLHYITLKQNTARYADYMDNCEELVREVATAKYVFLNDASDVISCLPMRPETKVIQLWHACGAFKKWGMSTADLKFGGSKRSLERHPYYKNLDLVTVSSPEVEWAYREAMVLEDTPEVVQALGVSRTDVFYDEDFLDTARDLVRSFYPLSQDKKVILYAPTFRGHVKTAKGPDQLDVTAMRDALADEYVLLIKHHPFVKKPPEIPAGCEQFAFQVGERLPIDVLMSVADICISDYSSIVFEYSLFERPMAFFSPDLAEYDDWRGFYYDYDALTPGPVFEDNASLLEWIKHVEERFDRGTVAAFRERFMSACDGKVTQRIAEHVFGEALRRFKRTASYERYWEESPSAVDVSVVIPAYNAMPELTRCLQSLSVQDYPANRFEVIIVDDCSSDGTWEEINRFAKSNPALFKGVRLDEQSGSPAKPRNLGLNVAEGRFVFFMDADDWLGRCAISKMLGHAADWDPDVMLVKMKGENGRKAPTAMFDANYGEVDVALSKVFWSIGPIKLYKRSFLSAHSLAFPTSGMPEDLLFVIEAMGFATRVSVASDYNYYHVSSRQSGGQNLNEGLWRDIDLNLTAYVPLMEYIEQRFNDCERNAVLMRRLFRRDVLLMLVCVASTRDVETQGRWYEELLSLFSPFYQRGCYVTTPIEKRLVLDAGMNWGLQALAELYALRCEDLSRYYNSVAYYSEDDHIWAEVSLPSGTFRSDVSDGLRSKIVLQSAAWREEGTLNMTGSVESSALFQSVDDLAVMCVLARNPESGHEVRWNCDVSWECYSEDIEDDYPSKGVWRAVVNCADISTEAMRAAMGTSNYVDDEIVVAKVEVGSDSTASRGEMNVDGVSGNASSSSQEVVNGANGPTENIWYLYLVMAYEGVSKEARIRYRVVSAEYPWGSMSVKLAAYPDRQFQLRGSRAGNFSLVEKYLPKKKSSALEVAKKR